MGGAAARAAAAAGLLLLLLGGLGLLLLLVVAAGGLVLARHRGHGAGRHCAGDDPLHADGGAEEIDRARVIEHARVHPDALVRSLALDRQPGVEGLFLYVARIERNGDEERHAGRFPRGPIVERGSGEGDEDQRCKRRDVLPSHVLAPPKGADRLRGECYTDHQRRAGRRGPLGRDWMTRPRGPVGRYYFFCAGFSSSSARGLRVSSSLDLGISSTCCESVFSRAALSSALWLPEEVKLT